ncbi:hypothetical protein Nocox_01500 [Nonomuraea coxensis DSM 45129]|uniref:Uncharacterized protein n=1 Tax=Nonomuraea coxensis DSM 45129 TaxID=1122611 RepID=A0ABX8TTP6_9ACTN|nr:hypothetical protein [Nonomuraea coxensis]QYC37934.1 hypothetical protein Nocox_01500 [Nonomuraea coxensis DSM 45129]
MSEKRAGSGAVELDRQRLAHIRGLADSLILELDQAPNLDHRFADALRWVQSAGAGAGRYGSYYAFAREFDESLTLARELASELASNADLGSAYNLARAVARELDFVCACAGFTASEATDALTYPFCSALSAAFEASNAIAEELREHWVLKADDEVTGGRTRESTVSRVSEHLIRVELWLLPDRYRARFANEFCGELQALAEAKATRALQVMYALQQLRRVCQLRAALRAPDQPRFYRTYRLMCWILAAESRTWGLLGPLMAFAIVNVFLEQGWGSAFYTLPAVVAVNAGVERLRKHWGVKVKARRGERNSSGIQR